MGEKGTSSDIDKGAKSEEKAAEKAVEIKETKEVNEEDKVMIATSDKQELRLVQKPVVDMEIFQQILELDEDDEDDFSREMVFAFFVQAEDTIGSMEVAL